MCALDPLLEVADIALHQLQVLLVQHLRLAGLGQMATLLLQLGQMLLQRLEPGRGHVVRVRTLRPFRQLVAGLLAIRLFHEGTTHRLLSLPGMPLQHKSGRQQHSR